MVGGLLTLILLATWATTSILLVTPHPVRTAFDRSMMVLGAGDLRTRCRTREQVGGIDFIRFVGSRLRYHSAPPRRLSGIYVDEFEGQKFMENAHPDKAYIEPRRRVWLTFDKHTDKSADVLRHRTGDTPFWLVDLIGEETDRPGRYGHMGMSDAELLLDHVNSAMPLQRVQEYAPSDLLIRRPLQRRST